MPYDTKKIPEGIIEIDTDPAKERECTTGVFYPESYPWRTGNTITTSLIISKRKGMFCQLIKNILEKGFDFEIPTPSYRMCEIGLKQKWNFYEKNK